MQENQKKRYYIETYGCQMNKYDSELVAGILNKIDYEPTDDYEQADLILVNTCSVRRRAETRVSARIGAFKPLKNQNPNLIVGVLGCMAQRLGPQILNEKSFVNFAIGPDDYRQLPALLKKIESDNQQQQVYKTDVTDFEVYADIYPARTEGVSAWVAIMRGCNNFCAYCIVPYLRGRERSRSRENILAEVRQLVDEGFKEVTLLGQNVNSYHDGQTDFPTLLQEVSQIPGIYRVRFASSHPKDISEKLINVMAETPHVCQHIHLAVQSGSNKVLELMNRHYTREHFLNLLAMARVKMPRISFTTDIIVGFPEETETDFQETLELVRQAQFDNAFTFKFNPREGTKAAEMPETVSETEKQARLDRLIKLQNQITLEKNQAQLGQVYEVLIEGPSQKRMGYLKGRTDTNKIVVFSENKSKSGDLVFVKIVAAEGHTLFGKMQA
ncbi:tRNA (N6-isopentenyl adenosine(37)-C2)-methylthiotransferase MiaB [candidate division KSB1 bacterium]|nr:tRNA (N6-isopentenyl adenosine(37)-C2)-methylthiotransferase MiaB [candidate division KSB1 bacterium]